MRRIGIDVVNLDCMITTGLWLKTKSKAAEQKAKDTFHQYEFGWITIPDLTTLDQALSFNSLPDAETEHGTLLFQINGAKELGLIWRILNEIEYSDGGNLEIVIPKLVPANRIKQILPLHQTKHQFKTKRSTET